MSSPPLQAIPEPVLWEEEGDTGRRTRRRDMNRSKMRGTREDPPLPRFLHHLLVLPPPRYRILFPINVLVIGKGKYMLGWWASCDPTSQINCFPLDVSFYSLSYSQLV